MVLSRYQGTFGVMLTVDDEYYRGLTIIPNYYESYKKKLLCLSLLLIVEVENTAEIWKFIVIISA